MTSIKKHLRDGVAERILEEQRAGKYRIVVAAHKITTEDEEAGESAETVYLVQTEVEYRGPRTPGEITLAAARDFITSRGLTFGEGVDHIAALARVIQYYGDEILRGRSRRPYVDTVEEAVAILNDEEHDGVASWYAEGDRVRHGLSHFETEQSLSEFEALAIAERYARTPRRIPLDSALEVLKEHEHNGSRFWRLMPAGTAVVGASGFDLYDVVDDEDLGGTGRRLTAFEAKAIAESYMREGGKEKGSDRR